MRFFSLGIKGTGYERSKAILFSPCWFGFHDKRYNDGYINVVGIGSVETHCTHCDWIGYTSALKVMELYRKCGEDIFYTKEATR